MHSRINMAILLPPYSKNHIIVFGSLALLAAFALLFIASSFNQSRQKQTESTVTPVTAQELKSNNELKEPLEDVQNGMADVTWASKNFVILDIRPAEEFDKLRLSGSHNAPLEFLKASSLNPDVDMVVYSDNEDNLTEPASILADKGIRDIYLLHESLEQLKSQGYTLEEGAEE